MQSAVRAHAARVSFIRLRGAAAVLQAVWRGRQCRQLLLRGQAASTVQRYTRRMLAVKRLWDARRAAICIQAVVRMHQHRGRCVGVRRFIAEQG